MNTKSTFRKNANDFLIHTEQERGITLVALIITIITLVILAAVTIRTAYQTGIIQYAMEGTIKFAEAEESENRILNKTEDYIEELLSERLGDKNKENEENKENRVNVSFNDGANGEAFAEQSYFGSESDIQFNSDRSANVDENGNPIREGYEFMGWDKSTDLEGNVTYTARWAKKINEYEVRYTDGVEEEEVFSDQAYIVEEGNATPKFQFNGVSGAIPTRDGYNFEGWAPTVADTVKENAIYTATWSKNN